MRIRKTLIGVICMLAYNTLFGVVNYDEGRLQINGVQLLQDRDDPTAYYYLPQYPRLSAKEDGSLELLCMKYIGQGGAETNGGIFHALIEFTLPTETITELESALKKLVPDGKIAGPVPLKQAMQEGEDGIAGFQVVSSILTNTEGDNPFTRNVITSGHAPLLPGSRAAIAAKLNQEGATLLWESLQSPTSDVSVSLQGYYEAAVKGYNAVVTADVSTVYEHMSRVYSQQKDYTKRQVRKVTDELIQNQMLNIDVFDRSKSLGIKADDMEGVLSLITDKLIELMFDTETGWSKEPGKVAAVEQNQLKGRQERGFFSKVFGGARDEKYVTDDQFVLKKVEDIRSHKFYLNISKSSTVKVPVYTSGNIGVLYEALGDADQYFKVVNLDDVDFQKREVHFQVDGQFAESFKDILNFVSISFKKDFASGQESVTEDLVFKRLDLEEGKDAKAVAYPRLGTFGDDWLNYEYRLSWSLKGSDKTIQIPYGEGWLKSKDPAISLAPPFGKRIVEIDADRAFFKDTDISSATIRFFVILNGEPQHQKTIVLKSADTENSTRTALYHDPDEPVAYQVNWYSRQGNIKEPLKELSDDYLFLVPPSNNQ